MRSRRPIAPLAPYVAYLWAGDGDAAPTYEAPTAPREHVLPSGTCHLVLRLAGGPLRLIEAGVPGTTEVGHAVVGGPRAGHYVREAPTQTCSVGVQLRAGAARALLGVSGAALAGRHVRLDDLWPRAEVDALYGRLADVSDADARLDRLEAALLARLQPAHAPHLLVGHLVRRLDRGVDIAAIVSETGYSHRHVTTVFRECVGMTPKRFARVQRFSGLLDAMHGAPERALVELALDAGFSDQAHMQREFRAMAGVSPGVWRQIAPRDARHVPVA